MQELCHSRIYQQGRESSEGKMRKVNRRVIAEQHGPFDRIAQFANIPRPIICQDSLHGSRGNIDDIHAHLLVVLADEETHQLRNILSPVAQRRQMQVNHF